MYFDEKSMVLHAEVQPTVPIASEQPERIDDEYERQETANLLFWWNRWRANATSR